MKIIMTSMKLIIFIKKTEEEKQKLKNELE